MDVHADPPSAPDGDDADPLGVGPNHLACAYSPSWLSGPAHYEGLVATFSTEHDEHEARSL
jgi:hypothetical protein